MTVVIAEGFAQVSIKMRNAGDPDPWYVVFGVDTNASTESPETLATEIFVTFAAYWANRFSTATAIESAILRTGSGTGATVAESSLPAVNGSSTAAKLPQNCALLVRKNTSRGGRTGRGRMFVPNVLREGDVDDVGVLQSSFRTELQNTASGWLQSMAGGGDAAQTTPTPMVLLHNVGAPGGTVPTPVTSLTVDSVISTQRRRLRR